MKRCQVGVARAWPPRRWQSWHLLVTCGRLRRHMKLAFGDCVLDLSSRQLFREGNVVPLEPKMFELLEVLIKRRPAVVANNELDELLWPKVYVARTSLTRLVSELRSVLGDTPRDSRIIRTVYKTGYAFCAEVTALPSAAVAAA